MAKFAYSAIDATGAEIEGTTKADTLGTARSMLVERNLFPIRIEESRGMFDFELTKEKAGDVVDAVLKSVIASPVIGYRAPLLVNDTDVFADVELQQKDKAREVLKGVVEDHPSTAWAQEAQKRLAEIQ